MPIKSILRGIPLLFGSKEVAVELEYPPKSLKTQWPSTLLVSHIHIILYDSVHQFRLIIILFDVLMTRHIYCLVQNNQLTALTIFDGIELN